MASPASDPAAAILRETPITPIPTPTPADEGYVQEELVKAMTPVTERSIRRSVELNAQILSEALFPIMGPALRKSIAHALEQMTQSLNATMENSLSPQSFRWRIEAWRTGKSFAEVVILRTLLYRVDQVFLIEKGSGLLLQQAAVDPALAQNSELVSAMLTAIQDFVRDSFHAAAGEGIGAVSLGELTLWVETGPQAVLAAVIRGTPPQELRDVFHDTLIAIHQDYLEPLASFGGQTDLFEPTQELLRGCLREQRVASAGKGAKGEAPSAQKFRLTPVHVIGALLLAGLAWWSVVRWQHAAHWRAFEERVRATPGIVWLRTVKSGGHYVLEGLRDPIAEDPVEWAGEYHLAPGTVTAQWRPYQSFDAEIMGRRMQRRRAIERKAP